MHKVTPADSLPNFCRAEHFLQRRVTARNFAAAGLPSSDIQQGFDRLNWIVIGMGLLIVAIGFAVFARKKALQGSAASGATFERSRQFVQRRT